MVPRIKFVKTHVSYDVGIAGFAQGDIAAYYDSLNCLRIMNFPVTRGLDVSVAAACLRHQLLPAVQWKWRLGVGLVRIGDRSIGSLTCSRFADMIARVPVPHMCCTLAPLWAPRGFSTLPLVVNSC